MNIILTTILGFFYRFFRNHQREIENLMLRVIEAIAEDVIRKKKAQAKAQDDSVNDTSDQETQVEQSPLS